MYCSSLLAIKRDSADSISTISSFISNNEAAKENWSQEEDELLIELKNIKQIGTWVEIAAHFKNKNPKQCSYRFKKLGVGPIKEKWTREQELKLFQLVDEYGDRFDRIKPFFNDKTEEDIRVRYYKNVVHNCINFDPEEDTEILKMYYNSEISSTSQKLIMLKGIENVKRRLQLLLKNKGEELQSNFDINSLIPIKLLSISKSDAITSYKSNKETTICSNSNFTDSIKPSKISQKQNLVNSISPKNESLCDEGLKLSLNDDELQDDAFSYSCYRPYRSNLTKCERKLSSQCLSKCHSELDFNEFNILQENSKPSDFDNNLFEASFLSTFSKDFNQSYEFCCEIDLYSSRTLNVESLVVKKNTLESILAQIITISNQFNEGIEERIKNSKLKEHDQSVVSELISKTLLKEKELAHSLNIVSIRLEDRQQEHQYSKDLLLAISLLGSLIQTNKLKMKLISKVMGEM